MRGAQDAAAGGVGERRAEVGGARPGCDRRCVPRRGRARCAGTRSRPATARRRSAAGWRRPRPGTGCRPRATRSRARPGSRPSGWAGSASRTSRCRATRCRRRPACRTPRMPRPCPSIASVSMYGVSPRSGLPKLRQFVIAAGVPPAQATLSADSQTASAPPRRGSSQTRRAVAVERHGDRAVGRRQPHDAGVGARAHDRAGADVLVVLAVDPRLRRRCSAPPAASAASPRGRRAARVRRRRRPGRWRAGRAAPA